MNIESIKELAKRYRLENTHSREGQSVFNVCFALNPEKATELLNSKCDCYYNDKNIDKFIYKFIKICLK